MFNRNSLPNNLRPGSCAWQKIRLIACLLVLSFSWGVLLADEQPTKDRAKLKNGNNTMTPASQITSQSPSKTKSITPLSSGQKFKRAMRKAVLSPVRYAKAGTKAGLSLALGEESHYRKGPRGYFRRFGDRIAGGAISEFAGNWAAASLLHQDPRYYPSPDRRFIPRVKYALTRTVITRGDNGDPQFNASNFIGIGASSTASAAWYPREAHRLRFGFAGFGSGIAFDAVGNLVREFFIHPRKKRDID